MFKNVSDLHALTCFLNSLWREWSNYRRETFDDGDAFVLPLNYEQSLVFPLKKFSSLGRHEYKGDMYLSTPHTLQPLTFDAVAEKISNLLGQAWETDPRTVDSFRSRVVASRDILCEIFEDRAVALQNLAAEDFNFIQTEQALLIGHNFHPSPKSRDEFSFIDRRTYSPEHGGAFGLQWLSVHKDILHRHEAHSFTDKNWTQTLAHFDLGNSVVTNENEILVPMHPWQWKALQRHTLIQKYIAEYKIIPVATSQAPQWRATSSVRAVYAQQAPYMIKFSMSVRLTNSIRHLQHEEVERGLQVTDVLDTPKGREYVARHPEFQIITEPAYMALLDEEGRILPETVIVCRQNPFLGEESKNKMLLATLLQDAVVGEKNYMAQLFESSKTALPAKEWAKEWFKNYLRVVVEPLMDAQSNYGILFGAHQQNLILHIENGLPVKAYFRDCQGSGYSELGFSLFSDVVDTITRDNGNVLDQTMGNALFSYYLFINSTWNVIAALCAMSSVTTEELLSLLRESLFRMNLHSPKDNTCLHDLLTSPQLMHKGNFLCSLKSFNENTIDNPFVIYTPISNSIAMASIPQTKGTHAELRNSL